MATSGQEPFERSEKVARSETGGRAREKATEAAQNVQQRGKARLDEAKDTAARQVGELAGTVDETAGRLAERDSSLAGQAGDLAARLERLAESLRSRSLDDLIADAQSFARQNPALFLLGSAAVGVVLSRFLKASGERRHGMQPGETAADTSTRSEPQMRADETARPDKDAGPDRPVTPPTGGTSGPMETLNIPEGM